MESNTVSAQLSVPAQVYEPDPRDHIRFANGTLHVPSQLFDPTAVDAPPHPSPHNSDRLTFAYDPSAKCPAWQLFLMDALGRDTAAIQLLREWFGYCMVRDTRMGRLLVLLGDPQSILAVIPSVLTGMIPSNQSGRAKVNDMGSEHIVRSFQSKFHYTIENESLSLPSSREVGAIANIATGRLVYTAAKCQRRISWADTPTRLTMLSPHLASVPTYMRKAIDRAIVIVCRSRNMDEDVAKQFMQELPGIANWAIAGLRSLRERGAFALPSERVSVVQNSVTIFAGEHCEVKERAESCGHDLFQAYRKWGKQLGTPTLGLMTFLKELQILSPHINVDPSVARYGRTRNIVRGLKLKDTSTAAESQPATRLSIASHQRMAGMLQRSLGFLQDVITTVRQHTSKGHRIRQACDAAMENVQHLRIDLENVGRREHPQGRIAYPPQPLGVNGAAEQHAIATDSVDIGELS